jgi:hypothetical protein
MVPFSVIGAFLVLLFLSYFVVDGAFRPDSENGSLRNISPILPKPRGRDAKIKQVVNAVLEAI